MLLQNGQLIEEDDKKKKAVPPSVGNPLGAQQAGANPDQAKMAGSSAQQNNATRQAITSAVKPPDVQQTAQQTQAKPQPLAVKNATTMADRLGKIGGLNDRVDQLVATQLTTALQPGAQLNVNLEGRGLPAEQEAAIKAYIAGVNSNDPNLAALEDSMNTILKTGGVVDPTSYLQTLGVDLAKQGQDAAKASINPDMPLASLAQNGEDFATTLGYDGGSATLAADLGISEADLAGLTLSQLQQKIKDTEEQHFSQVERLRAELATASPNRAAQIKQELAAIGATGQAAVDQSVASLNAQLESAEEVEFAGSTYTISDLLSNNTISDIINRAVVNPEEFAELQKNEPALADWITTNKTKLTSLVNNINASTEAGKARQTAFAESSKNLSPELTSFITGLSQDDLSYVSQAELDSAQASLASSGLAQAVAADPKLATIIGSSLKDEALMTQLKGMSADEIKAAREGALDLAAGGPMAAFLQAPKNGFLLDPTAASTYGKVKPILDTVGPTVAAKIAADPGIRALVVSGELGEDEAAYLAEFPNEINELVERQATFKQIADLDTPNEVAALFGLKNEKELTDYMAWMRASAQWGDLQAAEQLNKITALLGNNFKELNAPTIKTIQDNLRKSAGQGQDLLDFMKNNSNQVPALLNGVKNTGLLRPSRTSSDLQELFADVENNDILGAGLTNGPEQRLVMKNEISNSLSDGKISPKEWLAILSKGTPEGEPSTALEVYQQTQDVFEQQSNLYKRLMDLGVLDKSTPPPVAPPSNKGMGLPTPRVVAPTPPPVTAPAPKPPPKRTTGNRDKMGSDEYYIQGVGGDE